MNRDQLLSLVRTVLKWASGFLIAHGAAQASTLLGAINPEDVVGLILGAIAVYTSHAAHSTETTPTNPPKTP